MKLAQPGKVRRGSLPDPSAGERAVPRGRAWRKTDPHGDPRDLDPLTDDD
jgi:hypothetical protein